jgi:hypothetical protein
MIEQSNGTVFLEWPRSRGEVARLVQQKYKGQHVLHLRVFYLNKKGELKPSPNGLTIPVDQIVPLRKALKKVNERVESGSKYSRSKEKAVPKPKKKSNSWGKHAASK